MMLKDIGWRFVISFLTFFSIIFWSNGFAIYGVVEMKFYFDRCIIN